MSARTLAGPLALLCLAACASPPPEPPAAAARPFVFSRDTFGYSNDLYWEYGPDGTPASRDSGPVGFGNRCAPMALRLRR